MNYLLIFLLSILFLAIYKLGVFVGVNLMKKRYEKELKETLDVSEGLVNIAQEINEKTESIRADVERLNNEIEVNLNKHNKS